MRVVQAVRFEGPEVLVMSKAPDPVAGPGQVAVAVSVAPVLSSKRRSGVVGVVNGSR